MLGEGHAGLHVLLCSILNRQQTELEPLKPRPVTLSEQDRQAGRQAGRQQTDRHADTDADADSDADTDTHTHTQELLPCATD